MADRFTEEARRVLDLAREEAERFGHRFVGPEHLVLGLLRDGGNPAAGILQARGVDLAAARAVRTRHYWRARRRLDVPLHTALDSFSSASSPRRSPARHGSPSRSSPSDTNRKRSSLVRCPVLC